MGLLSRAHGRLQQILYGDLVPQGLIEQPLPRRQLAVGQDLDLLKEEGSESASGTGTASREAPVVLGRKWDRSSNESDTKKHRRSIRPTVPGQRLLRSTELED